MIKHPIHAFRLALLLLPVLSVSAPGNLLAADDPPLAMLEEQAMNEAVARVAPSVVSIETVGGLEKVDRVLVGSGPTTGLIVSPDGYIISSAFNFIQKPSSILVRLPDGTRSVAERVATDYSRMLVLLKVQSEKELPVPEAAPLEEIKVGQWAIALGRTFEAERPNVSVGIVSAMKRIFGRAMQTDAKISPANYGGPLVDIRGRVLGVLVPMSPQGVGQVAGVELYDAGIGFAVPLSTIQSKLDTLKQGEDLRAGILGIAMKKGDPYAAPAEIASARPKSPAREAGLKPGDKIVDVDGEPIATQMQLKLAIGPRYAGETVRLVARRGEELLERNVTLVDELPPYAHPFLGVLPLRPAGEPLPEGVTVRYVMPDSPAAEAGLQIGDRITELAESPVGDVTEALDVLNAMSAGDSLKVKWLRGDEAMSQEVTTTSLPTGIPGDLTPAHEPIEPVAGQRPKVGWQDLRLPQFSNLCRMYVPENYHPGARYGVVVWLHESGGNDPAVLEERWTGHCRSADLILLAPEAEHTTRWTRPEAEFVRKALDTVMGVYNVDRRRVVAHGYQAGGAMAYYFGFENRDVVRAIAAVDAPLPLRGAVPANDPAERLAILTTQSEQARFADRIEDSIARLREAAYPLTVMDLGEEARYLSAEELVLLVRWIDALDWL